MATGAFGCITPTPTLGEVLNCKAPKGKFRVVAEDTFPWPPEEYLVGDFSTLKQAKKAADKERGPFSVAAIFDEIGKRVE